MEKLYLRKCTEGFELILQEEDEKRLPKVLEFLFEEAGIVLIYPDGKIDAIRVGATPWHLECYLELFKSSPHFNSLIRSLKIPFDWRNDYNTYRLDKILVYKGVAILHNIKLKDFYETRMSNSQIQSFFYTMYPRNISSEQSSTIAFINENLKEENYNENWYDKKNDEFYTKEDLEMEGKIL